MRFLVDHNLEGHALLLAGRIASLGWLDLLPIQFITFAAADLPIASSDRIVWRFAQAEQLILLTANRSMKGQDSLEQVIREENTAIALPIVTISNADRILTDAGYRDRCVDRLLEIVLDVDAYRGCRRLFVP
ncbi:ACP S-malonyltransferase [Vacuolonema iberomarrocanum]|uniref:ACP S-malonyltransferase n=1 Tax=Vacuolonema iberomarrocanum TaxID=3454632 RepID=UPI0019E36E3A|nr:ACP S-malonyltransferase [filamentous cyanobacterium LEGE 07170]